MILVKSRSDMWGTRRVYKGNGCYIKEFDYCDHYWYHKHIKMVDTINPGYYINTFYSTTRMTFIMKTVPGVNAKTLGSGIKFVKRILKFVHSNIQETGSLGHGDWALENIIVNGNDMQMIDWDACGVMTKEEKLNKAYHDLKKDFEKKGLRSFDNIWRESHD